MLRKNALLLLFRNRAGGVYDTQGRLQVSAEFFQGFIEILR